MEVRNLPYPFLRGQPLKCFSSLFLMQTDLKDLSPVLKPASICGMDLVNGEKNSGCYILKVGNVFLSILIRAKEIWRRYIRQN